MEELFVKRMLKYYELRREDLEINSQSNHVVKVKSLLVCGLLLCFYLSPEKVSKILKIDQEEVHELLTKKPTRKEIRLVLSLAGAVKDEDKIQVCKFFADKGYAAFEKYYGDYLGALHEEDKLEERIEYLVRAARKGNNSCYIRLANLMNRRNRVLKRVCYELAAQGYNVHRDVLYYRHEGVKDVSGEQLIHTIRDDEYLSFYRDDGSYIPLDYREELLKEVNDDIFDYDKCFRIVTKMSDFLTTELKYPKELDEIKWSEFTVVFLIPSFDLTKVKISINISKKEEMVYILDVDTFELKPFK